MGIKTKSKTKPKSNVKFEVTNLKQRVKLSHSKLEVILIKNNYQSHLYQQTCPQYDC